MKYLYVDTSDHLIIGLLNEEYEWVQYIETDEKKSSGKLHSFIFELLQKWQIEAKNLNGVFTIAGPGSYTGIRLAEGIAQVFEWLKIPVYSFNHHQIPMLLGIEHGIWCANAYKGEYFLYKWHKDVGEKILHPLSKIVEELNIYRDRGYKLFGQFPPMNLEFEFDYSGVLIKTSPKAIFSKVVEKKLRAPSFYFRALDHEFKTTLVIE